MKIVFEPDQEYLTFVAGQVVFRRGDPADRMFAVVKGRVAIVVHGQVVETVEADGVFGEMALVDDKPRNATATATTDTTLAVIDRGHFLFLVQRNPTFALELMKIMAGRLRKMDERL